MDIREQFLKIFFELLKDESLSVLAFSKLVAIDDRVIRQWIKNGAPNLCSLTKIADYFKCSLDYLVGKTIYFDFIKSRHPSTFLTRYNLLREKSKLKDIEIADFCSVSKGTVSRWKSGRVPVLSVLEKLCELFGCSFDYLVGRTE